MNITDLQTTEVQTNSIRSFVLFLSSDYIYTAAGEKIAKRMKDNTYQYYAGNMVYNSSKVLDYIIMEEGLIRNISGAFTYEYNLKDHLGNTRVVFKQNGAKLDSLQITDYYPFGSTFNPTNPDNGNKYLYNGKEKQDDVLSGTALDWYDYGARFYDPMIGRWHSVDNKAEKYFSSSPYVYALNNPLKYIDPDGNEIIPAITTSYSKTMDPRINKSPENFGVTSPISLNASWNDKTGEVDIEIGIETKMSFLLKDNGFNNLNSGLKEEVQFHEEKHQQQIIDGLSSEITYTASNGKEYKGTMDKVATQMFKDGISDLPMNDLYKLSKDALKSQYPPNSDKAEDEAINYSIEKTKEKNPDQNKFYSDETKIINYNYKTEDEKKK